MTCAEAGIPKVYWQRSIADYQGNVNNEIMTVVERYISRLPEMKGEGTGLFFIGPNGTGKTGLMCEILKSICDAGFVAIYSTLNGICDKVKEGWDSNEVKQDYQTYVLKSDFLAVDDIGKEYRGKTDFVVSILDRILRYRAGSCRVTFITSNFNAEEIRSVYGNSIASLLGDAFIPLVLVGKDFRETLQRRRMDNLLGGKDGKKG